jgi:hypothetical protein
MKYAKILGLMAVAVAALMAFAATASATTLTSPTGTTYTSTIKAESEGTTSLDGAFVTVSCAKSTVEGTVSQHGTGVTVKGNLNSALEGGKIKGLTFSECNFPVTVNEAGSLEIHPVKTNSSQNVVEACATTECTGTLTSSGTKVTIETSLGTCVFKTSGTDVGLVTPTNDTGGAATLDIGAHGTGIIPRTEGSFLCGSSGTWTGSYKVTTPGSLFIDS